MMHSFLQAHGFDPGPTQRPGLAGMVTGMVATLPATAVLLAFRSLQVEAEILGLSVAATLGFGLVAMLLAGGAYGRIFQRGANDRRGGWLFGMAYGFLLWTAGAVMILPALSGGLAPGGKAAIGLFLSLVTWGTALGGAFPPIHRLLHTNIRSGMAKVGPESARTRGVDRAPFASRSPRR